MNYWERLGLFAKLWFLLTWQTVLCRHCFKRDIVCHGREECDVCDKRRKLKLCEECFWPYEWDDVLKAPGP